MSLHQHHGARRAYPTAWCQKTEALILLILDIFMFLVKDFILYFTLLVQ